MYGDMMFSDNEVFGIEKAKEEIKSLIRGRQLLWNGITRNVVFAGGFFTAALQLNKFKDIDIFILNNDVSVYNDLTQGFVRQSMAGPDTMRVTDDPTGQKEWSRSEIMRYKHNPNILDVINNNVTKAQYILTKHKTREDLLNSFDFKHCKVSYVPKNDTLFINRETYDCIKNKVLTLNGPTMWEKVQKWRSDKFLKQGWVLEADYKKSQKRTYTDILRESYDEMKEAIAAKHIAVDPFVAQTLNDILAKSK